MSNDFDEDDLVIFRCPSLRNKRMLGITVGNKLAFCCEANAPVKLADWSTFLVSAGVPLTDGKPLEQIRAALGDVTDQEGYYVADQPGFNGSVFAFADGAIVSRLDAPSVHIGFRPSPDTFQRAGSVDGWQAAIRDYVYGEPVLTFVLAIGFAAPLLALSNHPAALSFELVGGSGTQSDVAGQLLLSMMGRPELGERARRPIEARSFIAGADRYHEQLRHLPIVVDSSSLYWQFTHAPKGFAQAQALLRFAREQCDATFLLVGDRSVASLMGDYPDLAEVAENRLMTINIGRSPDDHVFINDPPEGQTKGMLANALRTAVQAHHGGILPAFIQRLIQDRHDDEAALLQSIDHDVARFRSIVKPDSNNSHAVQIANAFGLLFAGIRLARHYKLVPEGMRGGPIIEQVYQAYLVRPVAVGNLAETLYELAVAPTTLRLGKDLKPHTTKRTRRADVFVHDRPNYIEVMIRPSAIDKLIAGWSARVKHRDVLDLLVVDGKHLAVWRHLHPELERVRMHAFRLPRRC